MMLFPERPIIQAVKGEDYLWELKEDYMDTLTGVHISEGYRFDGASIPRCFWRLVGHPMQGNVLPAALLHDAKYSSQYGTKKEADKEFLFDMKDCGVPFFKRWVFFIAVSCFGKKSWDENRRGVEWAREFVDVEGDEYERE